MTSPTEDDALEAGAPPSTPPATAPPPPEAVVTFDAAGTILVWNAGATALLGHATEQALGRDLTDLVVPAAIAECHRALLTGTGAEELERTGSPIAFDLPAVRADGRELCLRATLVRTSDDPLNFTAVLRERGAGAEEPFEADRLALAEELVSMGSWQYDLATGGLRWSEGMKRLHGVSEADAPGTRAAFLELVHPDDRQSVETYLADVLDRPSESGGRSEVVGYRIVRGDGAVREIRARGHMPPTVAGGAAIWIGFAQDVTDLRLAERELGTLHAVSRSLREWEASDQGLMDLLGRLGAALDYPLAAMWTWDEAAARIACRAFWAAGEEGSDIELATRRAALRPGQGIAGRAWRSGKSEVAPDLPSTLGPEHGAEARALGLRSAAAIPILRNDERLAVLAFYGFDGRRVGERLSETLAGIGDRLGGLLSGRRSELGPQPLSARELEVLGLASEGNAGPEIATRLHLSPSTVKSHFEHIYEKLGVTDRAAAVAHALRTGLLR